MEKIRFSVSINATNEKVWQTLWNDASYRKWAKGNAGNPEDEKTGYRKIKTGINP